MCIRDRCWILLKSKLLTFFFQVREALLKWFLDVRGSFKARLPLSIFVSQAKELYRRWITHQEGEIPLEKQLKFSKTWIKGWMNEYRVSLNKPNKRYISATDRKDHIIELLKNVWRVRYWFSSKFGKEITVINGDQMPLHRNENASQKSLSFKGETTYVKENYMLSRERITVFLSLIHI